MSYQRDRAVTACPYCDGTHLFEHKTGNIVTGNREYQAGYNARDPEAYRETDYTCSNCGQYLMEHELIEREAKKPTAKGNMKNVPDHLRERVEELREEMGIVPFPDDE